MQHLKVEDFEIRRNDNTRCWTVSRKQVGQTSFVWDFDKVGDEQEKVEHILGVVIMAMNVAYQSGEKDGFKEAQRKMRVMMGAEAPSQHDELFGIGVL